MKNTGKIFEEDFRNSVDKSRCLIIRIPDPPQSFAKRADTSFSRKNPCDFIIFDSKTRILFPVELKSTKYKSMSFDTNDKETKSNMIKWHQIKGLSDYSDYCWVKPCFIFNFRDEENDMQRTYCMPIQKFISMKNQIDKHSFNEIDLIKFGSCKIEGKKRITRYRWNIENLFDKLSV